MNAYTHIYRGNEFKKDGQFSWNHSEVQEEGEEFKVLSSEAHALPSQPRWNYLSEKMDKLKSWATAKLTVSNQMEKTCVNAEVMDMVYNIFFFFWWFCMWEATV